MEFFEHVNPAMNSLHQSDHVDQAAETTGRVMHVVRHGQASHNVALAAGEIPKEESRCAARFENPKMLEGWELRDDCRDSAWLNPWTHAAIWNTQAHTEHRMPISWMFGITVFTKCDRFDVVRFENLYQPTPRLTELGRHQVSLVAKAAATAKPEVQQGEVNHSCVIGLAWTLGEFESTKGCRDASLLIMLYTVITKVGISQRTDEIDWISLGGIRARLFVGLARLSASCCEGSLL